MTKWIDVNATELDATERKVDDRGAIVVMGLSPDDIPDKVRGRFKAESNECIITFRYLTATVEPRTVIKPVGNLRGKAIVGARSGRLYQVRVILKADEAAQVSTAIDSLANDSRFPNRRRHFKVAGEVVSDNVDALMAR
jgi:hypothetical protein